METLGWLLILMVMACFAVAPAFPFVRRRLGIPEDSPEARAVRRFLRSPLRVTRNEGRLPGRSQAERAISKATPPLLAYPQQLPALPAGEGNDEATVKTHLEMLERDKSIFAERRDLWGEANVLNQIGFVLERRSEFTKAVEMHTRALELFEQWGDPVGVSDSFNNLGVAFGRLGFAEEAMASHRRALRIREVIGGVRVSNSDNNLGVLLANTQPDKAREYFIEAGVLAAGSGDDRGYGKIINNATVLEIGGIAEADDMRPLCDRFEQALALRNASEDQRGNAKTKNNLGVTHSMRKDYEQAQSYFQEAATLAGNVEDHVGLFHALRNWLSVVHAYDGKNESPERLETRLVELQAVEAFPDQRCLTADCEAYPIELGGDGLIPTQVALLSSGSGTPADPATIRARVAERDAAR